MKMMTYTDVPNRQNTSRVGSDRHVDHRAVVGGRYSEKTIFKYNLEYVGMCRHLFQGRDSEEYAKEYILTTDVGGHTMRWRVWKSEYGSRTDQRREFDDD